MQGLKSGSKGLETKPIEIWDLRLHDKGNQGLGMRHYYESKNDQKQPS
jgi:hypothetical protein